MTNLGTSFSLLDGFEGHFPLSTGRRNLGEAIARRCSTDSNTVAGQNIYHGRCLDVRQELNGRLDRNHVGRIAQDMQRVCLYDERVEAVRVDVTFSEINKRLTINLTMTDAEGTFPLILEADAVTLEILNAAEL